MEPEDDLLFYVPSSWGDDLRLRIHRSLMRNVRIQDHRSHYEVVRDEWSQECEALIRDCLRHLSGKYSKENSFYWSREFEVLMRNRLIQGGSRYGFLSAADKPQYERMREIFKRVDLYRRSGNVELLVDIANSGLLEFVEGDHWQKHVGSLSDNIGCLDRLEAICRMTDDYNETGNLMMLAVIAALAMIEFVEGEHSCRHLKKVDDKYHYDTRATQ